MRVMQQLMGSAGANESAVMVLFPLFLQTPKVKKGLQAVEELLVLYQRTMTSLQDARRDLDLLDDEYEQKRESLLHELTKLEAQRFATEREVFSVAQQLGKLKKELDARAHQLHDRSQLEAELKRLGEEHAAGEAKLAELTDGIAKQQREADREGQVVAEKKSELTKVIADLQGAIASLNESRVQQEQLHQTIQSRTRELANLPNDIAELSREYIELKSARLSVTLDVAAGRSELEELNAKLKKVKEELKEKELRETELQGQMAAGAALARLATPSRDSPSRPVVDYLPATPVAQPPVLVVPPPPPRPPLGPSLDDDAVCAQLKVIMNERPELASGTFLVSQPRPRRFFSNRFLLADS
jgi:chromosome segregation ATPase